MLLSPSLNVSVVVYLLGWLPVCVLTDVKKPFPYGDIIPDYRHRVKKKVQANPRQ
jgi:hypothetical protein